MNFNKFIFIVIVIQPATIYCQKCSPLQDQDGNVLCMDITNFDEIHNEINLSWQNLNVINRNVETEFYLTGNLSLIYIIMYQYILMVKKYISERPRSTIFKNIKKLNLSKVGVLILSDNGFRDFDALKKLDISNTQLTSFKHSWFKSSNSLEYLDASRNEITVLQTDNLRILTKLIFANFSYNDLEQIETDAFVDMKQLDTLLLHNNDLQTFNLGEISNLNHLNLHDNSLNEVCVQ